MAPAFGQDAIRCWSAFTCNTDAYRMPALDIDTEWYLTAVLRADGRIFVHGSESGRIGICRPPEPPPGLRFVAMSVSEWNGLGLLSDGTLAHWHNNLQVLQPPPPLPAGGQYVGVSVSAEHALALRSDGTLVGWHLLNGLGAPAAAVPALPVGASVVKFKAGGLASMALLSNGAILGWGSNFYGELNIPPLPPNTAYVDLWPGRYHFFARRSDGAIVAWGDNAVGQCNLPPLPPGVSYVDFAAGSYHTVALRSDGQLVAWGDNTGLQCDLSPLPPGRTVVQIDAGEFTTLARLSDGSVVGWGGPFGERPLPLPSPNERFADVAMGSVAAFGVTSAGEFLSLGPFLPWLVTPPPLPPGIRFERVFVGWNNGAALRSDGQLVMWGSNLDGKSTVPPLPPGQSYVQAALADSYTMALRSDHTLVAFGRPGQMPAIPPLPAGVRYTKADIEGNTPILLRSDGRLESLGYNGPESPPAGLQYVDVAAGDYHQAALLSNGQVVAWRGNGTPFPVPPLPAGIVYVEIDCGLYHFAARRSDGQIAVSIPAGSSGQELVPALQSGESYVQISGRGTCQAARVGPTRTYVSYASGCAGSQPPARLVPRDTPAIGSTHRVRLFDLPQSAACMVFGWNRIPPVSLAPLGLPTCFQHVSLDAAFFLAGQNGQAVYELPIPNFPALIGQRFYNQAVVLDPGANSAGAVVSDAAEGVIGRR